MKLRTILFAMILASGGIALGANSGTTVDLNDLQASPLQILDGLAPQGGDDDDNNHDADQKNPAEMPQACKDAAITPEQKTKVEEAVYSAMREKVQLMADLKLAFMSYGHIAKDVNSDMPAAQAAGTQLTDSISKLAVAHVNLVTRILYEVVTPEQRPKTFECIMALHKKKHKKQKNRMH